MTQDSGASAFINSFTKPVTYKGDSNIYVRIAKTEKSNLAMHMMLTTGNAIVNGKSTNCLGLGLRLIEVGGSDFAGVLGFRGASKFKDNNGEVIMGQRLLKIFTPVVAFPVSDPVAFREYTDQEVMPAMLNWLKEQVKAAGGEMALVDDALLESLLSCVAHIPAEPLDTMKLFEVPGVKPSWYTEPTPTPKPTTSAFDPEDEHDGGTLPGDEEDDGEDGNKD
jgi:hypothetical protein